MIACFADEGFEFLRICGIVAFCEGRLKRLHGIAQPADEAFRAVGFVNVFGEGLVAGGDFFQVVHGLMSRGGKDSNLELSGA